ncbi:MAG TPA: threonine synthase [Vicinamibacterales bacterium]|nr:threonine synthase [Vicinamibacterales bacterium]
MVQRFVSTRGQAPAVGFREALFAGLAPDGGLYVPRSLPAIDFDDLRDASLVEAGAAIAARFVGHDVPRTDLERLLADALSFPIPVALVGDRAVVELFHGPTFAFKDIGARVMARLMAHLHDAGVPLTILVATSGDTGSAVAQAFHGLDAIRVVVLFPEGAVTPVQEAQFTTLGGNVIAVAVAGAFDDCQRLVKQAFADQTLSQRARLTSANSINIGRLLPQTFYFAHAALRSTRPVIFSVPSGNFGNLTAGLMAWKMGAPIARFVAATTINDTVPRYLASGRYEPHASLPTLANAMDVGHPSNLERMRWLFDDDVAAMRHMVTASVHTDDDVRRTIREVFERFGYLCDPHTAIAYAGLDAFGDVDAPAAFLATAHPAKFKETVEPLVRAHIPLPRELAEAMARPRAVERIPPQLQALTALL